MLSRDIALACLLLTSFVWRCVAYSTMLANARCGDWLAPGLEVMGGAAHMSDTRALLVAHRNADGSLGETIACDSVVDKSAEYLVTLDGLGSEWRAVYAEHALQARGATFSGMFVGCNGTRAAGAFQRGAELETHTLSADDSAASITLVGAWQTKHAPLLVTRECVLHLRDNEL